MSITIEKVSYTNQKDSRVLEATLIKWFQNPKELNLTSPNMSYPFKYKKWVSTFYTHESIESFVIKSDDWIVGIGNLNIMSETNRAHAFHIFIVEEYRRQGLGVKIMSFLESVAKKKQLKIMTLWVMPKNKPAIQLYDKLGFTQKETSKKKSFFMEKSLI